MGLIPVGGEPDVPPLAEPAGIRGTGNAILRAVTSRGEREGDSILNLARFLRELDFVARPSSEIVEHFSRNA